MTPESVGEGRWRYYIEKDDLDSGGWLVIGTQDEKTFFEKAWTWTQETGEQICQALEDRADVQRYRAGLQHVVDHAQMRWDAYLEKYGFSNEDARWLTQTEIAQEALEEPKPKPL